VHVDGAGKAAGSRLVLISRWRLGVERERCWTMITMNDAAISHGVIVYMLRRGRECNLERRGWVVS
jgi:hypothetical protein